MIDRAQFRDPYHYGLAVASQVAEPALRVIARAAARSSPTPPSQWRTGAILGNNHIGDVLYRTCSLELLKRGLPDCRWSYITTPSTTAVLKGNPSVDEVLPWNLDADAQRLDPARSRDFATRRFDVALCSDNVSHHRALWFALRMRIPNRVAFTRKGLSGLATERIGFPESVSHPAAFRRMVEQITGIQDTSELRPRIFPSTGDAQAADTEWTRLGVQGAEFVIASSVTKRQTIGDFPVEFFADILRRALEIAPQARVVLNGLAEDRPRLDAIARELGERAVVSAGVLPVLAFGALLRRCTVFLGADSGPRHLANAARIPVIFVRNMGASEIGAGVYCPTETDIAPHGEYLSPSEMRSALDTVDRNAAAIALVAAARKQLRDRSEDTPR